VKPTFKHIFWNLSKNEIDLLNVLINIVDRNDDFDNIDFDDIGFGYVLDTNMHELSSSLGYLQLEVDKIIQLLELLSKNIATVYYEKDNNKFMTKVTFIHQFNITSSNEDINKRMNMVLNIKIINIIREHRDLFELFYKIEKYNIKSKYSKIMYERYYKQLETSEDIEIETLIEIIDFGLEKSDLKWSRLNSNILKRVAKEINDKSNLNFNYSSVKTSIDDTNRKQTTHVRLTTILEPDIIESESAYSNEFLMSRKVSYYIERDIIKKFKQITKFKGKEIINDPEAYMLKLRREAHKNSDEYEAKVLLQEWLNNIKYSNNDHSGLVVLQDYDLQNKVVTVNNNYKLFDIIKKIEISSSARDTRLKINSFMKKGDYDIVEGDYIKECSISYTVG